MKKLFLVLLILAVAGLSFAQDLIGIAMPETHVLRWQKDGESLRQEAVKRGYRAQVQFGNADQNQQNQQVSAFLTGGAKLLVIGSINNGVGSVVREAATARVPVIAYDRIIQMSTDYDYYVTFNNYKVGTLQGQSIVDGLNLNAASSANPKYITLFAGSPTDANANFFFDGAMDVLRPHITRGALRVVGPNPANSADRNNFLRITTENWFPNIAKARMENLLNNDAGGTMVLDAVLAPNDTLARAIFQALKADRRYKNKVVIISGQDAEFESMMAIKRGEQYSTVFKDTAKLAEAAMVLADQILKRQTISIPGAVLAGTAGTPRDIGQVNLANPAAGKFVQAYLLDPVLITKNNLAVPVNAGFYTKAQGTQITK
ncbi:MAG: sugar-binding protein [Treponema sp.]|jgi:putative multiple sugar transport system substrate-binding protein|nr:sugar-binding protein [Treponema sp.]